MKTYLFGISIIIVMLIMIIFQADNYNCRLETENLKYCSEEAADSAMLYYNTTKDGYKTYDKKNGIEIIEKTMQNYLKLDNDMLPINKSYWRKKVNYMVYFFDDDMKCSVYKNGVKVNEFTFNYPYLFTDEMLGYKKCISNSTIIVTINVGPGNYRLNFISPKDIIRSSGYTYLS